jgi:hypothetical protein
LLISGLLLLAACGGRTAPQAPEDVPLSQAAASGQQALDFARLKQAISQYQQAYTLALARDDAGAVGDLGYNLAVAQLADDDPAAALRTALRTRDALTARATRPFAELDLVEAAALHRLGRDAEADRLAARAQAGASSAATVARASYVRGLVADKRRDPAGLSAALAQYDRVKAPTTDIQADRDELLARLSLLRGQYRTAAIQAQRAADLRRTRLDYRAMAGALALAAEAMQRAGAPQDAADLYLQAGESAASRGDTRSASRWLARAMRLAGSSPTRHTAQTALTALRETPSR